MRRTGRDWAISDSGHTAIWRGILKGTAWVPEYNVAQHSIAANCLSEEDKQMAADPERFWKAQVDTRSIESP